MARTPVLVDVDLASVQSLPCCGVKDSRHGGRCDKVNWLRAQMANGLRAKVLLTPAGRQCGYIEYLPGEHAWRGVDASGYLFIHCIWTHGNQTGEKGWGGRMVEACVTEAAGCGKLGVAVLAREGPWLAGPDLYLKHGFTLADMAPPDYQLLVRKFDARSDNPRMRTGWAERQKQYGEGLTIVLSDQCPHISKFASEIAESAARDYGLPPRIVELRSAEEAQAAPTPFSVFAVLYEGRVLADHQISLTRFHNIMKALPR